MKIFFHKHRFMFSSLILFCIKLTVRNARAPISINKRESAVYIDFAGKLFFEKVFSKYSKFVLGVR